jgi:hypothetical protein
MASPIAEKLLAIAISLPKERFELIRGLTGGWGTRDEKAPPIPTQRIHPAERLIILANLSHIWYYFIYIEAQRQDFQIVEIENGEPWSPP